MKSSTLLLILAVFLSLGFCRTADAKSGHGLVKEGNRKVANQELDDALVKYLEARTTRDSMRPELLYDIGGVFARKGDAMKADSIFRSLPEETRKDLLARSEYNRGTALAKAEQYDQAVDAFINSLKLNPKDVDSKANLELARRFLQQQQQQQQQNQDQDQDQNKDQQQRQQQQDQQNQQQDQQEQNDKQDEEQEQQEQQQQQEQEDMDKKMAERFLDKLQQDEKELLKQVVQQQIPEEKKKPKKDW